jgi:hypothetical protein
MNPPKITDGWRKSSYSGANGDCVEVAALPNSRRAVRDSKALGRGFLGFNPQEWDTFISSLKNGKFGS